MSRFDQCLTTLSCFSGKYVRYVSSRHSKNLREFFIACVVFGAYCFKGGYKLLGKLCQIAFLCMLAIKSVVSGVLIVFFEGVVFKIINSVVDFVSVFVIDSISKLWFSKKSLGDNSVDISPTRRVKRNNQISILGYGSFNHSSLYVGNPSVLIDACSIKATKPSKVRHLVSAFKSLDALPYFGSHLNPLYCLDGLNYDTV